MAKKTFDHAFGKDGRPVVVEVQKLTRHQKKSAEAGPIPWTKGPGKNPLKRAARSLWG